MTQYKAELTLILVVLIAFGSYYVFADTTFSTFLSTISSKFTQLITDIFATADRTP